LSTKVFDYKAIRFSLVNALCIVKPQSSADDGVHRLYAIRRLADKGTALRLFYFPVTIKLFVTLTASVPKVTRVSAQFLSTLDVTVPSKLMFGPLTMI
jgi:hypothetical protein